MRGYDDLILYDWFSFTAKHLTAELAIELLGLDHIKFQTINGARGYRERFYYEGISIHFGGREEVWVEMSGQGCRAFESFSKIGWAELFDQVISDTDCHVTRLDVALDDHTGLIPLKRIASDIRAQNFVSRFDYWEVTESSKGMTLYHGSPKSDLRFRIYDKAAEQGKTGHWVRFELQLRDERAMQFLVLMSQASSGEVFIAVVNNYLRYVNPKLGNGQQRRDQKDRWPTRKYWDDFVAGAEKITLYAAPGLDYNIGRLHSFVVNQAGAAAATYIRLVGMDDFMQQVSARLRGSDNLKYQMLLQMHDV